MPNRHVVREVHWPRPLDETAALAAIRAWAADQASPQITLEVRATDGHVVYLLGTSLSVALDLKHRLRTAVPEARLTEPTIERTAVVTARRLHLSTRHRVLRIEQTLELTRAILGALTTAGDRETLALQLLLGPRRVPLAIPNNSPSSIVMPWWQAAWMGNGGTVDPSKRRALAQKVSDHGYAATIRLGVVAATAKRRKALLHQLWSALRLAEAPGIKLTLRPERPHRLNRATPPLWWPLRLNAAEVLALSAIPVGDGELPGQPPLHPRRIAPNPLITGTKRIVGKSNAPGVEALLVQPLESARVHSHFLGPTGTGKTTLMNNLIVADMQHNLGVIVVDPQGDQVNDLLARIPAHRHRDVIVLAADDPEAVVGLNPLLTRGRNPEVVADSVFGIFKGLYENLGPRSSDLLLNTVLTLAKNGDASLALLPLFLTNARLRSQFTAHLHDPLVLGPYWEWFDALGTNERTTIIAPLLNKARPLLSRNALRHVLGQTNPKLSIGEVFRDRRILLVSLAQGTLGPDGSAILGGIVVSAIWQATTERYRLPPARRTPISVWLDEFSAYTRIPNDLADALARSRGANVCYTVAHQYFSQLTPAMKAAVAANTRTKVCFRLAPDDAPAMARGQSVLEPEDFTALGAHEVYYAGFAAGQTLPYASATTLPPSKPTSDPAAMLALSRRRWATPIAAIEQELLDRLHATPMAGDANLGRAPRRRA